MTGIVHESRLTRLLALRDQIDAEIASERDLERGRAKNLAARAAAAETQQRQQRRDAVPAAVVRQWARTYGHAFPERGRVPDSLIDQYLDANPETLRSHLLPHPDLQQSTNASTGATHP